MKDKQDHNYKNFGGDFPKPGTPADEAWSQMHELLVKHDLTKPAKKDKRRLIIFLLVFLFITAGISGYLFFSNNAGNKAALSIVPDKIDQQNEPGSMGNDTVAYQNSEQDKNRYIPDEEKAFSNTGKTNSISKNYSLKSFNKTNAENNEFTAIQQTGIEKTEQPANAPAKESTQNYNRANDTVVTVHQNILMDTATKNTSLIENTTAKSNKTTASKNKFHFGLQWNANFSLKNNSHYFDAYNGGKQYYMWLLPAAWAKMDIGKKHGILFQFNPYKQVFAGKQTVHIEVPWIASVDPDIVTRVVKTRGYDFGLKYEYKFNSRMHIAAGLSYTFQQDALYAEQAVEHTSGNVLSEKIYGAKRSDASFDYLKSSYLNWNGSVKYDLKKLSIGAGVSKPFSNLSADPTYTVKPLNGELYLQYRFK